MRDERMFIKNVLKLPQTNNKKKIREKHSRNLVFTQPINLNDFVASEFIHTTNHQVLSNRVNSFRPFQVLCGRLESQIQ